MTRTKRPQYGARVCVFAPALGCLRRLSRCSVHLVDGGDKLVWEKVPEGLSVKLPAQQRGDHAFGLRIGIV